jgi:hypothetical protein
MRHHSSRRSRADRRDADQIGRCRQSIVLTFSPTILTHHVLPIDVAGPAQALTKRAQPARISAGRSATEERDHRHPRLLNDTLVIDTVGVKIGPFAMVDMYGTPHNPALHVVERYRLLDYEAAKQAEERGQRGLTRFGRDSGFVPNPDYKGQGLQLEFTVEDDGVFTKPGRRP